MWSYTLLKYIDLAADCSQNLLGMYLQFCPLGMWLITPYKDFPPKLPWSALPCSFVPPDSLYFYLLQPTAVCKSVVEVSSEQIVNVIVRCHQSTFSSESMSSEEVRKWKTAFLLPGNIKILLILFQREVRYLNVKSSFTTGFDPQKQQFKDFYVSYHLAVFLRWQWKNWGVGGHGICP